VLSAYEKYLPELKKQGIFKHDVPDNRYAWFFADKVADFDYSSSWLSDDDYPQILSCGSKGFILAAETNYHPWGGGQSPTQLEKCTVYPKDVNIFGKHRHQCQLSQRNPAKSQALYDVHKGHTNDQDVEIYAQLIEEGYVVKKEGTLFCNVAVSTPDSRKLFETINAELTGGLSPLCTEIRENIKRIVKSTIPPQLKSYAKGFAETWLMGISNVLFYEALHNKGFITVPAKDENVPIACYIHEH